MTAEAFAAASGPLILTLMQTWLAQLQTQTEVLVSDPPTWAPPELVREAAQVADLSRRVSRGLSRLDHAMTAMTRAIPDGLADSGEPWPGAGDPWPEP
jgi:hypothetical protein